MPRHKSQGDTSWIKSRCLEDLEDLEAMNGNDIIFWNILAYYMHIGVPHVERFAWDVSGWPTMKVWCSHSPNTFTWMCSQTSRKANHIAVMVQNGSNISNLSSLLPSSKNLLPPLFLIRVKMGQTCPCPQDCMAAHRDLRVTSGNVSPLTAAMACLACPEPNDLNH